MSTCECSFSSRGEGTNKLVFLSFALMTCSFAIVVKDRLVREILFCSSLFLLYVGKSPCRLGTERRRQELV